MLELRINQTWDLPIITKQACSPSGITSCRTTCLVNSCKTICHYNPCLGKSLRSTHRLPTIPIEKIFRSSGTKLYSVFFRPVMNLAYLSGYVHEAFRQILTCKNMHPILTSLLAALPCPPKFILLRLLAYV